LRWNELHILCVFGLEDENNEEKEMEQLKKLLKEKKDTLDLNAKEIAGCTLSVCLCDGPDSLGGISAGLSCC